MDLNFFKVALGTGVVASIFFYILGMVTSSDIFGFVGLFIIYVISLLLLSSKLPTDVSFKNGAILGMVCMASMVIVGQAVNGIVDLLIYLVMFAVAFAVGGYAAKFIPGLLTKKKQQPMQQQMQRQPPQQPPQQPPAI